MLKQLDTFTVLLLAAIGLASVWPPGAPVLALLNPLSSIGITILFFVHGAALPRQAVIRGMTQWRLHLFIFSITFIGFPILLVPLAHLAGGWLPEPLRLGIIYLSVLPSAVSSSIAFTAMGRGNVPAAICSAALSNLFGLMLTPFLLALLAHTAGQQSFDIATALKRIVLELLLPFAVGQLCRPLLADLLDKTPVIKRLTDQVVILMVVYVAFAESMREGVWHDLPTQLIVGTIVFCGLVLGLVLATTSWLSRRLHFTKGDEIAAVFCGSKKSLASGLPMAKVLFAGNPALGLIVLPIMCYNQLQILIGPLIARRYAKRLESPSGEEAA
ncbi:bile acid:sodium symporter family protein [Mangrovitalea sediminis]|uniref:bile acid:sodium symporter family protein n=1 Tax=Mangrovitalea sediminis TaxID=1982043 RepID=UPI000BE51F42|nr:bile acid:sodium symporter family protein [Mangrovitalea sediminis]